MTIAGAQAPYAGTDSERARMRGGNAAAFVAALATALLALASSVPAFGAPAAQALTISPLNGTPDASPHTQISFFGTAAREIHDVKVVGSRSGSHGGRLESYASAPGASFLPASGFSEGEQVDVSALVGRGHHEQRVGSTFTVARLVHYGFTPMGSPPPAPAGTVQKFASEPNLTPPSVRVTKRTPGSSEDDVFIAANHGYGQWGPMIFDRAGDLVWFKPAPKGETAMDLQVQSYQGKPVLVWWQGYIPNLGIGFGTDEIYSSAYTPVASVQRGQWLLGGPARDPDHPAGRGVHHGLLARAGGPLLRRGLARRSTAGCARAGGGHQDGPGDVRVARLRACRAR